jgi:hypothetical protein
MPADVILGIHALGLSIFERSTQKPLLKKFHILEMSRWGYKIGSLFYFETKLDGKQTTTVEFTTKEGELISHLLTDYAVAYGKEADAEEERTKSRTGMKVVNEEVNHNLNQPNLDEIIPKLQESSVSITSNANDKLMNRSAVTNAADIQMKSPPPPPPKGPPRTANTINTTKGSVSPPPAGSNFAAKQYDNAAIKAAIKIQATYRGFSLRNEWIKEDSAILIQSVFRGYVARCYVAELIQQLFESGEFDDDEMDYEEEAPKYQTPAPPPPPRQNTRRQESV